MNLVSLQIPYRQIFDSNPGTGNFDNGVSLRYDKGRLLTAYYPAAEERKSSKKR